MKVVLPVAGIGTRLRPLTDHVPKILLPVAGQPVLGHILEGLGGLALDEVALVIGYRGDQVREYVEGSFDLPVRFVRQEEQLGLGHAVLQALGPEDDGRPVLVLLGDTIFDVDFAALGGGRGNVLGVRRVPDPERFGIAVVEAGRITRLVEKPQEPIGDLALVGIYRFDRGRGLRLALERLVEEGITTRDEYQLTDALQLMLEEGTTFEPLEVEGWFDCGTPEILLATNRALLERRGTADARRFGPGVRLRGPVHVAEGAELADAELGPHVAVGAGSRVERSVLRDAIVGRGAEIRDAVVERAIVGDGARVEGGRVSGLVAPVAAAEEGR